MLHRLSPVMRSEQKLRLECRGPAIGLRPFLEIQVFCRSLQFECVLSNMPCKASPDRIDDLEQRAALVKFREGLSESNIKLQTVFQKVTALDVEGIAQHEVLADFSRHEQGAQ